MVLFWKLALNLMKKLLTFLLVAWSASALSDPLYVGRFRSLQTNTNSISGFTISNGQGSLTNSANTESLTIGDVDTGGSNHFAVVTAAGVKAFEVGTNGYAYVKRIGITQLNDESLPGIFNRNSPTDGMYFAAGSQIEWALAATRRMTLTTFGIIHYGSPYVDFEMNGGPKMRMDMAKISFTTNVTSSGTITATNGITGSYGCLAMGTGAVTQVTGTLLFTNWAYSKVFGDIGVETNSVLVVTNARDVTISFGSLIAGGVADVLGLAITTNGVRCDIARLGFTASATSASETSFKEFAISVPAMCRIGINPTNAASANMTLQNLILNVKGAN